MQQPYGIAGGGHRMDKIVQQQDLVAHYREMGYIPPFRLFTNKVIDEIWQWLRENPTQNALDWEKGLAVNSRFFYQISTQPSIMEKVNALLGRDVILWGCSIVARPPATRHPWHCDIEAAAVQRGKTVNAWIGLRNTSAATGIKLIPFSHQLPSIQQELAERNRGRSDVTDQEVLQWAQEQESRAHIIRPELGDGDCLILDGNTWHSSQNTTTKVRHALLIQYATPDVPIRIPDINNFTWPFRQINFPKPPVMLLTGDDHCEVNHVVAPPPVKDSPGKYRVGQSRIYPLQLPLPFNVQQRWKPFPIFNGYTADLQHITCHVSALAPGHQPHPPHTHREEEILMIMHGAADVILPSLGKNHRVRLQAGEFVYYPAHFLHTIEGVSAEGCNYLMLKWYNDVPTPQNTLPYYQYLNSDKKGGNGKPIEYGVLFEGATASLRKLQAHITRLAPGAHYAPHIDPYDVAIIVLEGQVETLGESVQAGQVIFYPAGQPHGMANKTKQPASYVVFEFHGACVAGAGDPEKPLPKLMAVDDDFTKVEMKRALHELENSYSLRIGQKITRFIGDYFSWLPMVKKRM